MEKRISIGNIITIIVLVGSILVQWGFTQARLDAIQSQVQSNQKQIEIIQGSFTRNDLLEQKLVNIEQKIDTVDAKVDTVDEKVDTIRGEVK
jgi:outer membrane murein-binding lipoprotein Lpp